jgi:HEAT repeat protein
LEQFLTQPTAVRIEVIGQVLEDVDDLAMRVLRVLAVDCRDPDPNVRWSITEGLGSLQRLDAIELLELIAQGDPDETVRSGAIGALARRAMAAYREKAGPEVATPRTLVRTRGPVRTRGASPVRAASPEAATILEKLHRLRDEESSDYIRNVLDTTLVQLGE